MNIDEFWEIVERGRKSQSPHTVVEAELRKLPAEEVASYQAHFDERFFLADKWQIWNAAYLHMGGCSDDSFMDFRYWLISRGKDLYTKILNDPDSLVEVADLDLRYEEFCYAACKIFEVITGSEVPSAELSFEVDMGEEWDPDDENEAMKRLPRLAKKHYGSEN